MDASNSRRLFDYLELFAYIVIASAMSSEVMLTLNYQICPIYRAPNVLVFSHWPDTSTISIAPLREANFPELLGLGILPGLLFTLYILVLTRGTCRFFQSAKYLPYMLMIASVGWLFGALNGVVIGAFAIKAWSGIFSLQQQVKLTSSVFIGTHGYRFLAVHGATCGAYAGWLLGVVGAAFRFKRDWAARPKREIHLVN